MNVLILGGSRFVGRHISEALLSDGHRVTHFNRGLSVEKVPLGVEHIRGDRAGDLYALEGRTWDAIVDTCGYTPDIVERSARFFAGRTKRYAFISSVSVYDVEAVGDGGIDGDVSLLLLPDGADRTQMVPETYGALKALCEQSVRDVFGERTTIFRPGLVAGPHDPTDRFTYWPVRFDVGGAILAPGSPEQPLQYIDARDLAAFVVRLLERDASGTYNVVMDPDAVKFGDLCAACKDAAQAPCKIEWVDAAFLNVNAVQPWSDLPLWIPPDDSHFNLTNISDAAAKANGLRTRPLAETTRDTLAWARLSGKRLGELEAGLQPAREAELLEAYWSRR